MELDITFIRVRSNQMLKLDIAPQQRLHKDVAVLKIGGQSICDRGVKAFPAILKEIVANRKQNFNHDWGWYREYNKSIRW